MRNNKDLIILKGLIESGEVIPVIDRTYLLSDTPEAFRYVEEGHARGKVVITIVDQGPHLEQRSRREKIPALHLLNIVQEKETKE